MQILSSRLPGHTRPLLKLALAKSTMDRRAELDDTPQEAAHVKAMTIDRKTSWCMTEVDSFLSSVMPKDSTSHDTAFTLEVSDCLQKWFKSRCESRTKPGLSKQILEEDLQSLRALKPVLETLSDGSCEGHRSFNPFPRLPTELHLMIFSKFLNQPRVFPIGDVAKTTMNDDTHRRFCALTPTSTFLRVNHESRQEVMTIQQVLRRVGDNMDIPIYANLAIDTIWCTLPKSQFLDNAEIRGCQ